MLVAMVSAGAATVSAEARAEAGKFLMTGLEGEALDGEARRQLQRIEPLGLTLFARHMPDLAALVELTTELRDLIDDAVLAIDHEGGRVDRTPEGFSHFPPPLRMCEGGEPGLLRAVGRCHGRELSAVGFNLDFAPVLDVHTNDSNPIIGDRAFGTTPEQVVHFALPYLQGLSEGGVVGCGKHFPGHGDTSVDSHLDLPSVGHGIDRIRSVELVPFSRAVQQGIAMIMSAHLVCEAIDAERPASLSQAVLEGCLRRELGFGGVIVCDDLEMKAISDRLSIAEAAVEAVNAGNDVVLVCNSARMMDEAHEGLARAIADGDISAERVAMAEARRAKLLSRMRRTARNAGSLDALGCTDHETLLQRFA